MAILVTGGAGYIGSHTCIELLTAGWEPVVVDNLVNSSSESLHRVEMITGRQVPFHQLDIADADGLRSVFSRYDIDAVVHFAGLKAVGESVAQPLRYYQNNVSGTLTLCQVMEEFGVRQLIFSSSATVYGDPASVPIREDFPTGATNPYGASKLMVEDVLRDLCAAPDSGWKVSLLRYFNPIGAHESGTIGEDPRGIPNNLLPYVAQVAVGRLPQLQVFGDDYDTPDGTGVRDYIHVVDLARGHLAALEKLRLSETPAGCYTYNLGTGRGSSVLEIVRAFEQACGREIPYKIAPRRPGDIAECYADPSLAEKELGWKAEYDLQRMVEDTWRWQSKNPNGYSAE
ncbi:UDP-glucose 4-epimerase GalE [Microbulbifer thermotolerans]|uniref:UDP-glucose 4-epimerase GalE n=1 Tax=Microbulbifer thermotolerans TaxID=252514 RepID=UPI0008EA7D90|nr:UDP-glucose 4-epimerase GalE [Microbulbifer thermotolerans]MCX2778368.1 UDP-glucose 4-epimerase GalE [Microbulbifer thermotolerans]MCX2804407.1 UDP-glucose 4-epimerase GalE [Microbulbifer thermotolerans]MCX2842738.1 UDP-glucose 4-epimerase GalE [Microbulbifer thermotolerans]SFC42122.1 UDP-glucose 4-epimerase [Microbulbifer thermotolerans]